MNQGTMYPEFLAQAHALPLGTTQCSDSDPGIVSLKEELAQRKTSKYLDPDDTILNFQSNHSLSFSDNILCTGASKNPLA